MSNGYVYVLINESYKGLVKVGITSLDPNERARMLSRNTGVPTPFKVAYEIFVENCEEVERKIHKELEEYRINPRREFFNYPLNKTINLVQTFSKIESNKPGESYESIDILDELKENYGSFIEQNVTSVKIYQTEERVSLEVTTDNTLGGYLLDQVIRRTDLGFISDGYNMNSFFNPNDSIQVNVDKFLNCSPATHVVSQDSLFTKEGAKVLYNSESNNK
ncbi:GIY-YIG nuclease family protein [Fictibacillus sp. B-59209]|uniref:GIY-YIG nuclease family protein n=1 Tax=Fictibacillus sp. B-59209 TaxID=3024873 RepID=UPI002E1F67A2|nr:GIY-YIG nuclease family protein [Fictibacillus sp. B-59209]